tara:strand:- start:5862 stop:6224 length:363 start_codon:yes stop_codon:yes gene_type:complete
MWKRILKENGFLVYLKQAETDSGYLPENADFRTRDEAFDYIKGMAKQVGYTVVGSAKEGKVVKMEKEIFESLTSPSLYYVIKMNSENKPANNYVPDTRQSNTGEGTRRKFRGEFELDEEY